MSQSGNHKSASLQGKKAVFLIQTRFGLHLILFLPLYSMYILDDKMTMYLCLKTVPKAKLSFNLNKTILSLYLLGVNYVCGSFMSHFQKVLKSKKIVSPQICWLAIWAKLGIGIEINAAGIGIPASCISVQYQSIPVPDWVPLFWYRTSSSIGIFVYSGTGLTVCRTVRHSGI